MIIDLCKDCTIKKNIQDKIDNILNNKKEVKEFSEEMQENIELNLLYDLIKQNGNHIPHID